MNKTILLCLFLASTFAAFAQPTLTKAGNAPVAGDIFYGYSVDTAGVDSGAAGASVTWDMSSLVKIDSDTTFFLNCAATPYCDSFPGANIVMRTDSDYSYGISGADGLQMIGAYSDTNYIHFTDPRKMTAYPFTYGSTFKDTSGMTFSIMGFDIYFNTYNTVTADAWGTLKLPNGTFTNVLRVQTTTIQQDSSNFMGMPQVNRSRTESYSWFAAGIHTPLATLNYDTSGSGTWYLNDAKYYKATPPPPTTGIGDVASRGSINVYPNPAQGVVNIQFGENRDRTTISVLDIAGRELLSSTSEHTDHVTLPLNEIPTGTYLLRVASEGQAPETAKLIVR
ncbi:MAG: T9SS type A sorting domain-containing protein [Taibaiella sp.]|nr:T9SS type A sorting domain-containing protein [Taibaiella sp.]